MLLVLSAALPACGNNLVRSEPGCNEGNLLILEAQAVPSASFVPCISDLPVGWSFGGERIRSGRAEFWLNSDRAGDRSVTVILTARCDHSGAIQVPTEEDEAGTSRYEEPQVLPPHFRGNRYYVFPGGCVTYSFAFGPGATFTQAIEATQALTFFSRAAGVTILRKMDLELCGRGVRCPG